MNRVNTLLDAQELLAVEGVRNQMAYIVCERDFIQQHRSFL